MAFAAQLPKVSNRRATGALVVLSLACFCYVTTELLPIGLLTVISSDLHRTRAQTGLLVTGYAVVVIIASVPLTHLTRRIPRRILLGVTLGVFAAATFISAAAPTYAVLLGARLVIALTQAMFWSVVAVTATGLFSPEVRGRVVARLSIGNGLAPVLGVPASTWLGQQAGWRTAFVVVGVLNLATCAAVWLLVPTFRPEEGSSARGTEPNRRRFLVLIAVTSIVVTGFLTTYTYITPFLFDVTHFAPGALGPLLFVSGASGVIGTIVVGQVQDGRPWATIIVPMCLLTLGLFLLYALGTAKPVTVVLVGLIGFSFGAFPPALQTRVMQVAPGSTDLASAGVSSAFNVGIATGSFLGGLLIAQAGSRSVALFGACLAALALSILLVDRGLRR